MYCIDDGILISSSDEQLKNEYSFIETIEYGIDTCFKDVQSLKVELSIFETEDGIVILTRDEQPQNAESPIY